jgi:hypothetical protein
MLATSYPLSEETTLPFDEAVEGFAKNSGPLAPIAADVRRRLADIVARSAGENGCG